MTTEEIAAYYANLLILQYKGKPNAYAFVLDTVLPLIMDQMPTTIRDAFDMTSAVGVQLDVLGKYIGVTRYGNRTNGSTITLDDTDYRKLIMMVLIRNNNGSSLATIQSQLSAVFPGMIFVSDTTTMSLNYLLIESLGTPDLLEMLVTGDFLPRPMGVNTAVTTEPSHSFPFFGFITTVFPDPTVSPFNTNQIYNLNAPWLGYNT
jgi:hypothetical protein